MVLHKHLYFQSMLGFGMTWSCTRSYVYSFLKFSGRIFPFPLPDSGSYLGSSFLSLICLWLVSLCHYSYSPFLILSFLESDVYCCSGSQNCSVTRGWDRFSHVRASQVWGMWLHPVNPGRSMGKSLILVNHNF